MRVAGRLASIGAILTFSIAPAAAQSLTPMRGEVRSLTEAFAVRVHPSNPYDRPIRVDVRVYDQDFAPVDGARVSIASMTLAAGATRPVIVAIPFDGQSRRKVRICAESIPFPEFHTKVRSQICGRFLGTRVF